MTNNEEQKTIVTRFAPSPTGNLHIGGVRTALFNFLFAKRYGGKFILRIEDTDKERSKKEYEESILQALKWVGLAHDELYRQSDRTDIYKTYLRRLVDEGHAYVSKETPKEEGDRTEVIRFKNPNKQVDFHDQILGDISVDTTDLGDFVIAKDFDTPLYHLVVVVDDSEMGVTHVIRAQEHIANTPRQILIQEAIGASRPQYAHIPLILAPDRTKLSKRHGAISATEYQTLGYLPEAIVNYLALLGWNPGTEQELFSMEELIAIFSLEKIQKGGAIFDTEKLNWFNKQYLGKLSAEEFRAEVLKSLSSEVTESEWFREGDVFDKTIPIIREKISRFGEASDALQDLKFFFAPPEYEVEGLYFPRELTITSGLPSEAINEIRVKIKEKIDKVVELLNQLSEDGWSTESIKNALWEYATQEGRGNVLWPTRFALTGKEKSPDPFTVASILGKEETLSRLKIAQDKLAQK